MELIIRSDTLLHFHLVYLHSSEKSLRPELNVE